MFRKMNNKTIIIILIVIFIFTLTYDRIINFFTLKEGIKIIIDVDNETGEISQPKTNNPRSSNTQSNNPKSRKKNVDDSEDEEGSGYFDKAKESGSGYFDKAKESGSGFEVPSLF